MSNQLVSATSPYLLQHADNPVQWRQWGTEALAEARRRNVPILLSVGYAACHWCHVMAHESFEDSEIAALMNDSFVNIKVDREERPDIDAIYMNATQAMTGQGGWPMTCFLTPDGAPFHCGTYYPPAPRHGLPSLPQLLEAVSRAWRDRPGELAEGAQQVVDHLAQQTGPLPEAEVDDDVLSSAVAKLGEQADTEHGGFGNAPKFPPSMVLEFLLRHTERTGSAHAAQLVDSAAEAMARGGMCDQLAGGFARYSVDAEWIVPHFEKMLYDNALQLRFYAHLARRSGGQLARRVADDTAGFILRDLATAQGAFAASLDADTEGVEGLTYVWTPQQLIDALGVQDGQWAAELFGVTEQGTFERGTSTLRMATDPDDMRRWERVRETLLRVRESRPQPARDDKVVTAWNGLVITALAEAGLALERPQWIDAARGAATFVMEQHVVDGRLRRSSRAGEVGTAVAVLEDHGCLAEGLLALYQATGESRWLSSATWLLDLALDRFAVPDTPGAFYDTADDAEALVHRPIDPADNASPSGASALASALLTASALAGADGGRYRDACARAVNRAGALVGRVPRFAGHWLAVAEAMRTGPVQVAVVGQDEQARSPLLHTAAQRVHGGGVVLAGAPEEANAPLLADRPLVDGGPAAYVCQGYVCDRPVTTEQALTAALAS